ncbi:phosphate ABC transporter substrate-binding protein PstS family protein [Ectothiorhodospira haloalkaliphila]|uniref:PstS family phosphate ABC transporter substrate-binding protein n=1 Tax=Ectothiorhodospira haloalkaliphila TaxID=421628 RepID=UPI001EE91853|nr:phosphate ABC transporter substrate-binding protein PstS family protein [Ectothiorhodospira haloalkaliphila]MCG5525116.1 phosphate ABC transporter substrate-binding protein PstS family protein [Ectothiorhodospira haloalkaliphila]
MKHLKKAFVAAGVSAALVMAGPVQSSEVDPNLPTYERVSGISGNLSSIGSDTLNNLMTLWAEEFNRFYPNVNIQIQGAGSGTAPPAITEGTANFGPMSRTMRSSEKQSFEERHGYPPTEVAVGIDLVAVFVNKDNPIEGMSLAQVDSVFSETRRCGADERVSRWGELGLGGGWENRDIALYGRNAVSGTYGFFRQHALCGGDFSDDVNEQPGSASVVQGVTESLNGIGYSGIGYQTAGVKAIKLGQEEGNLFEPNAENALTGDYPMARSLMVYVNSHPNDGLPPLEREFLRMVLSKQGQEVVARDGFVPLPESVAGRMRTELGLE